MMKLTPTRAPALRLLADDDEREDLRARLADTMTARRAREAHMVQAIEWLAERGYIKRDDLLDLHTATHFARGGADAVLTFYATQTLLEVLDDA